METIARIIMFFVLLPMWMFWLLFDLAHYGTNYREWALYSMFFD